MAIVALNQRENIDDKTLGDIFYDYGRCLPDIGFIDALNCLIKQLKSLVNNSGSDSSILNAISGELIKEANILYPISLI